MYPPRQCSILIRPRGPESTLLSLSLFPLPRGPRFYRATLLRTISSPFGTGEEEYQVYKNTKIESNICVLKAAALKELDDILRASPWPLSARSSKYRSCSTLPIVCPLTEFCRTMNTKHVSAILISACVYVRVRTYARKCARHTRDGAMRRTRVKRNGCIIGMRLRCNYLPVTIFYNFSTSLW